MSEQINKIVQLIALADTLEAKSIKLKEIAQGLCTHKAEDGTWAVYVGFGCAPGEEDCSFCELPACYIEGYSK